MTVVKLRAGESTNFSVAGPISATAGLALSSTTMLPANDSQKLANATGGRTCRLPQHMTAPPRPTTRPPPVASGTVPLTKAPQPGTARDATRTTAKGSKPATEPDVTQLVQKSRLDRLSNV